MISARLGIFRSGRQSLGGLCAQLERAGCSRVDLDAGSLPSEATGGPSFDILVIDARAAGAQSFLAEAEQCAALAHVPILLVTANEKEAEICASWSSRIDDIVPLPVDPASLRNRIKRLSRLNSMTVEWIRRRTVLSDFGITSSLDAGPESQGEGIEILIVGKTDASLALLGALSGRMKTSYAPNSLDAVEHLRHMDADLIMVMPTVTSTELRILYRQLNSLPLWTDLPIVVVSHDLPEPLSETSSPWTEPDLLRSSICPPLARLRLGVAIRQSRLRRLLRGLTVDGPGAGVMDGPAGVYSHAFFHQYLDRSISDHLHRGAPLSIVTCTIEGLSAVNERWGYPAGDELLRRTAFEVTGGCRTQDLVARIGGARFGIVLGETPIGKASLVSRRLAACTSKILDLHHIENRSAVRFAFRMAELAREETAAALVTSVTRGPEEKQVSWAS